jgi:flagellar motility protein MotE (MotC chaperone)
MNRLEVGRDAPGKDGAAQPKTPSPLWTYLRIWLPFPLMLGAILFLQLRSGGLQRTADPVPEEEVAASFQTVGQDVPALMQTLAAEKEAVQKQRDDLEFVQRRIVLEQSEIATRQKEVEKLLDRVESKVGKIEGERDQVLTHLARVYETMRAKTAAGILSGLDVETATEVLRRMKEKKAAEIMGHLSPEAAAKISKEMLR